MANWPSTSPNNIQFSPISLIHSPDQRINEMLPVAMVTTLLVVPSLLSVAASSTGQLKRPQEMVCLFEVRACDTREMRGSVGGSQCATKAVKGVYD